MRSILILILSFTILGVIVPRAISQSSINPHYPLDTVLTRDIDVTGDNKTERICLRLCSKQAQEPFYWTLEIWSGKSSLFKFTESDSATDFLFSEDGQKPQEYLKNKYDFFFRKFANLEISKKSKIWKHIANDSKEQECILRELPKQLMNKYHLNKHISESATKRILSDILEAKLPLFMFSAGVNLEGPYVYCVECNQLVFIPFYTN